MQRLAALGCDTSPLTREPLWMGPFYQQLAKGAEKLRAEWGQHDGDATIAALAEAM